jgi:hypothetical protein
MHLLPIQKRILAVSFCIIALLMLATPFYLLWSNGRIDFAKHKVLESRTLKSRIGESFIIEDGRSSFECGLGSCYVEIFVKKDTNEFRVIVDLRKAESSEDFIRLIDP